MSRMLLSVTVAYQVGLAASVGFVPLSFRKGQTGEMKPLGVEDILERVMRAKVHPIEMARSVLSVGGPDQLAIGTGFVEEIFGGSNTTSKSALEELGLHKVPASFPFMRVLSRVGAQAPVLDAILRAYSPSVVSVEVSPEFAPPVEFAVATTGEGYDAARGGCAGLSLQFADRIFRRNGYRLVEAEGVSAIAVHKSVAHLFEDRPQDTFFWYQAMQASPRTQWKAPATRADSAGGQALVGGRAQENSPMAAYGSGLGLFSEVRRYGGNDNFARPPMLIWTVDNTMADIAQRVQASCQLSGSNTYLLNLGERCCAPQWGGEQPDCVCELA